MADQPTPLSPVERTAKVVREHEAWLLKEIRELAVSLIKLDEIRNDLTLAPEQVMRAAQEYRAKNARIAALLEELIDKHRSAIAAVIKEAATNAE